VLDWYGSRGWQPFDFQQEAWQAYLSGQSGLIHAPTGIGKTYAAWMGPVLERLGSGVPQPATAARRSGRSDADPLRVLWITPLRALAAAIAEALNQPCLKLGLPWSIETRTGDTIAALRLKQKERLPTALVTTPESLAILMSYPGLQERFAGLRAVVVDEWHELIGSKRGVLAELALAGLRSRLPGLRIWGLSATLGNTETAMQALLGDRAASGRLIRGLVPRTIEVQAAMPAEIERFPWAGHLGLKLLPRVIETVASAASTLLFTNTRSQCEIWFRAIIEARPDWKGQVALHHGSLDRRTREAVEARLAAGGLRCVVCTSSLDLGVDFSPVDCVVQVGSPKGIARLLQRAGRSGHRPGETSRITCVPASALELLEVAAIRRALREGFVEPRTPLDRPLDVLTQHVVTLAAGDGFRPQALFREVSSTHAFRHLTPEEFDWVVDFTATGGASLRAYREYAKIVANQGIYSVDDPAVARRHRMSIGTITSDADVLVRFLNGKRVGQVEERFVARLKPGDTFILGGQPLEFVRLRDMSLYVRKSRRRKGAIPQWLGGRMPLSTQLAALVRRELAAARNGRFEGPEMNAIRPLLELQARWSVIPAEDELLVEVFHSREGHHLFLYPFEGRLVNEGLGALVAFRLARRRPLTLSISVNDYGIELLSDRELPLDQAPPETLFSTARLTEDIMACLNAAEMSRRQFREIARVAGLVFQGYPGRRKGGSQLQASSSLLFNVFERYDPENLLLRQSVREVLERQLEFRRLEESLRRMAAARLRLVTISDPTPLAFPILVNRLRTRLSTEKLADRVRRMQLKLERKAANGP
jgi:ATP-dependent Lhr-like helicase